ncbi:MAG: 4Fe-4S dicluster domain-containing protein [bacterium]|nr:4Fe-4S dicluster domain-containing protein [bacterium]
MLVIEQEKIRELVEKLSESFSVFAPTKRKDGECSFEKFEKNCELDFDYTATILPAKKFFFPEKEEILIYNAKNKKISSPPRLKKFILFGLNERDLEALSQLDEIMKKPLEDFYYLQNRKSATVIGVLNEDGTKNSASHFSAADLLLKKTSGNTYEAVALTSKGKDITKDKLFKEIDVSLKNSRPSLEDNNETMPRLRELLLDPELLNNAVKWSWENQKELWENLGKKCLGCGICTYVCPLCYCFSMEEKRELDGALCSRVRCWAACTLPEFNRISGGYNFHKTLKERYYNWYHHKFVRAYVEYGKSQCVACGRCQKYCPAKIDIEKVLLEITENYKKVLE